MAEAVPRHLVLVGMMGAGKTTVGRIVAARLGRPFLDSDELVEVETGRTVREIFETDGEAAFRRLEREVLERSLASPTPAVIAAAGGTVLDAANRAAMRGGAHVVWLRSDPAVLAGRVGGADHRPLLATDPEGVLRSMAADRAPRYREVADDVVDVDVLTAAEAAERVLAAVGVSP